LEKLAVIWRRYLQVIWLQHHKTNRIKTLNESLTIPSGLTSSFLYPQLENCTKRKKMLLSACLSLKLLF